MTAPFIDALSPEGHSACHECCRVGKLDGGSYIASMNAKNRQCGECSLCCKLVAVDELNKPAGQWCAHFSRGQGCTIYDQRPASCRAFNCHWLLDETMGDAWFPHRAKLVVRATEAALLVYADPGAREPWRQEPYLSKLVAIAGQLLGQGRMVIVLDHGHSILLLPDRIADLGVLAVEDQVGLHQVSTTAGPGWAAYLKRRGVQAWHSGPISVPNNFWPAAP